ncbi:MAG: LacI family DNA-binding transcriptional regulator, partial [Streptomyces sp.]|nr:LacI family DNA-binding transcriptional regulator [Streptomyces sp.]
WADLFSPRLTAIAQPSKEIGAEAVRVLLARLAAPDEPARTVRLPCTFVHRSSCGCLETVRPPVRSGKSAKSGKPGKPGKSAKSGNPEEPRKGTVS